MILHISLITKIDWTSSSAMAEGPRELDQRFQVGGVNLRLNYRLKGYFSRHCDMTQFTLTHHMVNKPYLLLGLDAKYRSLTVAVINVYNTDRWTKLTALETISRWLTLKKRKNRSLSHPLGHLGVTYALHLWPVVDFIFVVIELFSLSPTVETLWAEIGRSRRFSKGGGSLWTQISEGRGRRRPTTVGIRVAEWLPFRVV